MVTQVIGDMAKKFDGSSTLILETCEYLNISVCPIISESKDQVFNVILLTLLSTGVFQFDIIVYNPRGYEDDQVVIRVPISSPDVSVQDANSHIPCQVSMINNHYAITLVLYRYCPYHSLQQILDLLMKQLSLLLYLWQQCHLLDITHIL